MASGLTETEPITITYKSPGAQPPVYLAASFTSTPWEPQEMSHKPEEGGSDLIFTKIIENVQPGAYEYKFRLGPGDWWVLDETADVGECEQSL